MEDLHKVRCNNCDAEFHEDDLALVEFDINDESETPTAVEDGYGFIKRYSDEPEEKDFLKGCSNCETDSYLTNL